MKVKMTKVYREDIPGGMRTPSVIGECTGLPEEGKVFTVFAAPLSVGATTRMVCTTPVQSLDRIDNIFTIITKNNSVYTIEILDEC